MSELIKRPDQRRTFIETLVLLAEDDEKIVLLTPDVGFLYLELFQEKFPDRFYNTGVTEQFTILMAAAMALDGWKPYVYSMINFVLFRPYEMVRNGIVQHKANVKLLGVKGSSSYKFLGFSHNLITPTEDVDACKVLGIKSFLPKNNQEVTNMILATYESEEPAYIRLS